MESSSSLPSREDSCLGEYRQRGLWQRKQRTVAQTLFPVNGAETFGRRDESEDVEA